MLVLKTVDRNMQSHGGFQWPRKGRVTAPDWRPTHECGNGLHGFANGVGDYDLLCGDAGRHWLILDVRGRVVDLDGKIKFHSCMVLAALPDKQVAPLYADYEAKRAPLYADYKAKRAPLYADYKAKRAPLYADYEAKRAPLYADYKAKRDALYADYEAKRDALYADYEAKRDALYADYKAKRAPLYADYEAKHAPLYADYKAKRDALQHAFFAKLCKIAGVKRSRSKQ